MDIAITIDKYLFSLKESDDFEKYEVVLTALLHKSFSSALNKNIIVNLEHTRATSVTTFNICTETSEEYQQAIDDLCKSKYYTQRYSKYEIQRNKNILTKVATEITSIKILRGDLFINFDKTVNSSIDHKLTLKDDALNMHQISFPEGTPLNVIIDYLKRVLEVKNTPKKTLKSLGRDSRILRVAKNIDENPDDYKDEEMPYGYKEELIVRIMERKYGEIITQEAISKSLTRIKKIEKEVNS